MWYCFYKAIINTTLSSKDLVKSRWDRVPTGLILRFIPVPRSKRQLLNQVRNFPLGVLICNISNKILKSKKAMIILKILKSNKQLETTKTDMAVTANTNEQLTNNGTNGIQLFANTRRAAPKPRISLEAIKANNRGTRSVSNRAKEPRPC